jgi:2-methylcitrate dehydratase PrpD
MERSKTGDLASELGYVVDPDDSYPRSYRDHVRVTLRDGRVFEERQPHLRGGAHEPLSRDELERKLGANAAHGGSDAARASRLLRFARGAFDGAIELREFQG